MSQNINEGQFNLVAMRRDKQIFRRIFPTYFQARWKKKISRNRRDLAGQNGGRNDSDKGAARGRGTKGTESGRERNREKERKCNGAESRTENSTESVEHRMAEGMVGWIQLLGEQYCFAVIVCSSTCSGFPGLGPLASNPMSRYATIFCLLAITPSTTMTRKRRMRMMRVRMRMRTRMKTMMSIARAAIRRPWHLRKSLQVFVLYR